TLYFSLAITLNMRYGPSDFVEKWGDHFYPFSVIFILWVLVFYIFDLYNYKKRRKEDLLRLVLWSSIVSAGLSIASFYSFPDFFELTPKTNMALFSIITLGLKYSWHRYLFPKILKQGSENVLLLGDSKLIQETFSHIKDNPQIGYEICEWIQDPKKIELQELAEKIKNEEVNIIVIKEHLRKDEEISKVIYDLLAHEVNVVSFWSFYEMIFEKTPLEELKEGWFIENISAHRPVYDKVKRFIDILFSSVILLATSPIIIVSAVLIKLTSKGPVIFKQQRAGKGGREFTLYKFRTMYEDSSGPLWTKDDDNRVTPVGKALRYTHLDELPQLFNILKGDISLIGPRPEAVGLSEKYSQLPYYEIRQTVKPGLTGWAQLKFPASSSLEEAKKKLCYDIYYIKNRSIFLDIIIAFKTARVLFEPNR
ncbi:MAG: sugar transferase, partial [Candidatus Magasanikbacteria bacterium]